MFISVGRVFAKGHVRNFGRSRVGVHVNSSGDLFHAPFSFELLIGDQSKEQIKVVVWNTLVGVYFSKVDVGQIVALSGYRLKQSRGVVGHLQQWELSINPYNPTGKIRIITHESELDDTLLKGVPLLTMTVSTVAVVKAMKEESVSSHTGGGGGGDRHASNYSLSI